MRIGVLTGGGDCPGLNAVLRAVARESEAIEGHNLIGFRHGWRGVIENDFVDLSVDAVRNVLTQGGTMLGTSRCHPDDLPDGVDNVLDTLDRERIDGLIVVGGDGTLAASVPVAKAGVAVVGVPKTIDNDIAATDRSVGFDTAVQIATEAIDRVHTTAESHDRVMVVEVMGHHAGWIAVTAGLAGGADVILIPEDPFDVEEVAASLRHRHRRTHFSIVVVAEGATTRPGSPSFTSRRGKSGSLQAGAVGEFVRSELEQRTGFDTRVTVLGHTQRGGTPTASDRLLGSRFGVAAVRAVRDGASGEMVSLQGEHTTLVSLSDATSELKLVPAELRDLVRVLAS